MSIFANMGTQGSNQSERPFWDRKNQKAYRAYRIMIWVIVVSSLVSGAIIWFRMNDFLR